MLVGRKRLLLMLFHTIVAV